MSVLVTGASGLLGRPVYKVLKASVPNNIQVYGTCFKRSQNGELKTLDITDDSQLVSRFKEWQPKVVVHCVAERRPDVVEKSTAEAEALNVTATQRICDLAKENNCWVLYISTDYVFDGTKPPYEVDDKPNPLNKYGKMKYEGEQCVMKSSTENAVLRVPILYGQAENYGESAVTVIYPKVKNVTTPCVMDHFQRRFPTLTDNVADCISQMVQRQLEKPFSVKGIYHFSEPTMLTKYDMAIKMAEVMGVCSTSHITADSSPPATTTVRPYDCRLSTTKLSNEGFHLKSSDFKTAIHPILTVLQ